MLVGALIGIPAPATSPRCTLLVNGKSATATQVIAVVIRPDRLLLIIIPFLFLDLRPEATKARLKRTQDWLPGHALQLMATIALLLSAYLTMSALVRLS